jgi:hypothetical protein
MKVSVAVHFCGGDLAATRITLYGEKASCGMEHQKSADSAILQLSSNCCIDEVSVSSSDKEFSFSRINLSELSESLIQVFTLPFNYLNILSDNVHNSISDIRPPGISSIIPVDLSSICVFRL